MSITSLLSVARSALFAHQTAIETAGHNIANAETPGYSRQTVQLTPGVPFHNATGNFGTGVSIATIQRSRNALVDQAVRDQASPAAGFAMRRDLLSRVEGVFGEPSDLGLASTFDKFWSSWSDLASNPANAGTKTVVQQRAVALTDQLNATANQLNTLSAETKIAASDTVSEINRLVSQLGEINAQIVPAEAGGDTANDLRDQRDVLIDQLSELVPVTVIDRQSGGNQVMLGGLPLVDGTATRMLSLNAGPPLSVSEQGSTTALSTLGSGTLGAMLDSVNTDLSGAMTALDSLAQALITDVNAVHQTGWSPPSGGAGNWNPATPPTGSGVNFFDASPGNANARNIRLSVQVAASASAIAAGDGLNETGNNAIALKMAGLRDLSPSAAGNSFGEAYRNLITDIAGAARTATDSASVADTLVSQASARRASTSGVSTDEELMELMRHQQAYAAAAKLISVVDEMSQTILDIRR